MKKISQFLLFVVCVALTIATVSHAGDNRTQKAKSAFSNGRKLFEKNHYAAAAAQFKIAYKYNPSWKILYNIGQCEAGAKRYGVALEAFERYMVEGGDDIPTDRLDEVQKESQRLRAMVGMLNVTGPDGGEVFVDGIKRGVLPLSGYIPVSAAVEHVVSGVLEGTKLSVRKVRVMAEQTFEITLETTGNPNLAAAPAVEPSPEQKNASPSANKGATAPTAEQSLPPDEETTAPTEATTAVDQDVSSAKRPAPPLQLAGIITAAVGAAALIGGGVTGILSLKKNSSLKNQCIDGLGDTDVCVLPDAKQSEVSQRDTLGHLSTALFIGGGVVAAIGVVLFLIGHKKKTHHHLNARSVTPTISTLGVAATWDWRF